jgi:hypothetical protein
MWTPRQRKLTKTVSRQEVYADGNERVQNDSEMVLR